MNVIEANSNARHVLTPSRKEMKLLKIPDLNRLSAFVAGKSRNSKDERDELIDLLDAEIAHQTEKKQNATQWKPRLPGNCVKRS